MAGPITVTVTQRDAPETGPVVIYTGDKILEAYRHTARDICARNHRFGEHYGYEAAFTFVLTEHALKDQSDYLPGFSIPLDNHVWVLSWDA